MPKTKKVKKKIKKSKPVKKKTTLKKKKKTLAKVKPSKKAPKQKASPKVPRAPLPLAPKPPIGAPGESFLGEVEDFFAKISVIALTLKEDISLGDTIHIRGHTTDHTQEIKSIQIEHDSVKSAKKKDSVGIKITDKARTGDSVYLI